MLGATVIPWTDLRYLADRNYSSRTLRAYGYDLLAFCRWLDSVNIDLGSVTTETVRLPVLPPDADDGTPRECCVDDRQAARPLFLNHHQSPSRLPDGSVHLPRAART